MVAKITRGGAGSSGGLVNYLEKQQPGQWFNQDRVDIGPLEVTTSIDANKRNLGKEDDKYYQIILSPSEQELRHIGQDPEKLKEYTRAVMEEYAKNFNKEVESKDLVWYAKIEHERKYTHQDRKVQQGEEAKGEKKEGLHTHIHIVVSRTENLEQFKQQKEAGLTRKHPLKLSPATNHQSTDKGAVKGGFSRTQFIERSETQFDKQFSYQRPLAETFNYSKTMQHGTDQERVQLRVQALREEQKKRPELKITQQPQQEIEQRKGGQELSL